MGATIAIIGLIFWMLAVGVGGLNAGKSGDQP